MDFVNTGLNYLTIAMEAYKFICKISKEQKDCDRWRNVFKLIVEGYAQMYYADCGEIEKQIANALDDETINRLNELLKNKNGFEFQKLLDTKILNILNERFNDTDRPKEYVKSIHDTLLEVIKNDRVFYEQFFIAKNFDVVEGELSDIKDKLVVLDNKVSQKFETAEILDARYLTLYSFEKSLINSNKYGIDLDFFDYDEEETDKEILDALEQNNVVFIVSQSRLEATFYSARLLKKNGFNNVVIVNSYSDFNKCNNYFNDYIIICNFSLEGEFYIDGNKLIILKNRLDFIGRKNYINLPNRIRNNLYSRLDSYLKDSHCVSSIIQKTNGNFYSLMRELFVGFDTTPTWFQERLDIVLPILLLNTWSEKKGDKEAINKLSGIAYEEYIELLKPLSLVEDPLVVAYNGYGGKIYTASYFVLDLPNVYMLFNEHYRKIFREIAFNALLGDEVDIVNDRFNTVDKGYYSDRLKEGISKTLIALANVSPSNDEVGNITLKEYVLDIVTNLLESIITTNQWMNIAPVLPLLVQAAPDVFLLRINKAVKKEEEGFKKFISYKRDDVFGGSRFSYLLTAIEKTLFIDKYQKLSISLLMNINKLGLEDRNNYSSSDILKRVFCAWMQEVVLTLEEKIALLKDFIEDDSAKSWELLKTIIPSGGMGNSYSYLNKPEYVMASVSNTKLTNGDVYRTYKAYLKVAIERL